MKKIFQILDLMAISKNYFLGIGFCWVLVFTQTSCKKLAETSIPTDQVAENAVYGNDATAIAVMTSIYSSMNKMPIQGASGVGSIAISAGLSADEFTLAPVVTGNKYWDYYTNSLSQATPPVVSGAEQWAPLYNLIFRCNAAIEGCTSSNANSLTPVVRQQLLGEAKFTRAFFFFYLVNEFGAIPLVLTTDPKTNTNLPRSLVDDVYKQIISDLTDAESKLSSNYLDATLLNSTLERVRPTTWAAKALLARVYLYVKDYTKAAQKATEVLTNTTLFGPLPSLNNVFIKNSREAIWQIQPTDVDFNTNEAQALIIPTTGPSTGGGMDNPVYLNKDLLNSFETGDNRAVYGNWINTTIYNLTPTTLDTVAYPYKYKINSSPGVNSADGLTEYFMALRIGEQYLIRAEANTQLGNISGAQSDLNTIRNRAGLANTTASNQTSLLTAILNERRHELFSEWGHRWFDLKRAGNVDAVMTVVTPQKSNGATTWQSYKQLYPIPIEAINSSPNLTQNSGY
jgi:hypothetical protein